MIFENKIKWMKEWMKKWIHRFADAGRHVSLKNFNEDVALKSLSQVWTITIKMDWLNSGHDLNILYSLYIFFPSVFLNGYILLLMKQSFSSQYQV